MRRLIFLSLLLLGLLGNGSTLYADASIEVRVFYDALAPYGDWIYLDEYGVWVFRPVGMWPGWQPYTYGRWEWTEEYGWLWVSYFEWGWAPFHYGRWFFHSSYGWVWVPGTIWRPHWVVWYYNGPYVGWYPYYPSFVVVDYYSPVVYERIVIVESENITSGKYKHNVIEKDGTKVFGDKSGTHTYIPKEDDSNYHNYGPSKAEIEKISNKKFEPVKMEFSKTPVHRFDISTSRLQTYRPEFKSQVSTVQIPKGYLDRSSESGKTTSTKNIPSEQHSISKPKYTIPLGSTGHHREGYNPEHFKNRVDTFSPKRSYDFKESYHYPSSSGSFGNQGVKKDVIKPQTYQIPQSIPPSKDSDEDSDVSNTTKTVPNFSPKGKTLPKSMPQPIRK